MLQRLSFAEERLDVYKILLTGNLWTIFLPFALESVGDLSRARSPMEASPHADEAAHTCEASHSSSSDFCPWKLALITNRQRESVILRYFWRRSK